MNILETIKELGNKAKIASTKIKILQPEEKKLLMNIWKQILGLIQKKY